ncbi:winged helix-turn-helix transcriptional regulator [Kitasatospora acidiphila]|uniref:Winged helix-turn-helix transcriptional regulator n=1 Tax=Kitasatospora acidiphila TaxID=2567942 RepID=A0A540VWP0_9ACTN|nr:DUF5937 family protein [Kitasatospora acidiphila]TQF01190.1 winged helix-turn-helix transcriptional regulator [Kitasatospora acidiphila]
MLALSFTAADLARTRFAVSPLWEVMASARMLRQPGGPALYRPWLEPARARLAAARLDWSLLAALVPLPPVMMPVFIAPPPSVPEPDLALELAVLRATPPELVREAVAALDPARLTRLAEDLPSPRAEDLPTPRAEGPLTPRAEGPLTRLAEDPERGLAELAETVEAYWELVLAPYWPRMLTLLRGDVLHRARLLAEGGAQRLLDSLDPGVSWEHDTLQVPHRYCAGEQELGGRGLLLVPTVFGGSKVYSITSPRWQPTLRYPPRGVATLWEQAPAAAPEALAAVVGRSRALLLTELHAPASTTDLARRTGITPGGVSQHLTTLRAAGLVTAHRVGRFVLYARTGAAEALLTAATGA